MGTKTLAASGGDYSALTTMLDDIGDSGSDPIDVSAGTGEAWDLIEQDGGRWDIDASTHRLGYSNSGNFDVVLKTISRHAGQADGTGFRIYSSTGPASGGKYHVVGIGTTRFCLEGAVVEAYSGGRGAIAFTPDSDECAVRECIAHGGGDSDNGALLYQRDGGGTPGNGVFNCIFISTSETLIYLRANLSGFDFCGNTFAIPHSSPVCIMIGTSGGGDFNGNAGNNGGTSDAFDESAIVSAFACSKNLAAITGVDTDTSAPSDSADSWDSVDYLTDPENGTLASIDVTPTDGTHNGWAAPTHRFWRDYDALGNARAANRTVGAIELDAGTAVSVTDTGSGSETVGVDPEHAIADTGGPGSDSVAVDKELVVQDSGAGVDALQAVLAALEVLDVGAGVDAVATDQEHAVADAGSGAEQVDVAAGGAPVVTDSGAGVDDVADIAVALTITDAGSGDDSTLLIAATVTVLEDGSGAEQVDVSVAGDSKLVTDVGSAVEGISAAVVLAIQDAGLGTENVVVSVVSVAPSGPLSEPASKLRDMLAASSAWQTWTGAGGAAEAAGHVHIGAVPSSQGRPWALIQVDTPWILERVAGGAACFFRPRGELRLTFEDTISLSDPTDAENAFVQNVRDCIRGILGQAGDDDNLDVESSRKESGPSRTTEDEAASEASYYRITFRIGWRPC